jgi:hypothetical protein
MRQIFSKQEVTIPPFDCEAAREDLKNLERFRDQVNSDINGFNELITEYKAELKTEEDALEQIKLLLCGDLEEKIAEEARVSYALLSPPCYGSIVFCPLLYYQGLVLNIDIYIIDACIGNIKNHTAELEKGIEEAKQNLIDAQSSLRRNKNQLAEFLSDIADLKDKIMFRCFGDFIKDHTKITNIEKCNKSKERIKKLKQIYFKLSKNIFDIKLGLNGIKFLKLKKKSLIRIKPLIEEVIKKGEDAKRYVIETDDEKAFLALHSSNKAKLAENIKEQSIIEANLKNLLIKKEKTNNILKRTKKLLDLKIKQSIKLCN